MVISFALYLYGFKASGTVEGHPCLVYHKTLDQSLLSMSAVTGQEFICATLKRLAFMDWSSIGTSMTQR